MSVPRRVNKKPGDPKEERGVWALQEDIEFGVLKEEKKNKLFFQHWFVLVNRTMYLAYLRCLLWE